MKVLAHFIDRLWSKQKQKRQTRRRDPIDYNAERNIPAGHFGTKQTIVYPFVEGGAGVLMIIGGMAGLIAAPFALFVGTIGAWSVYKAVYIDKRDIKCACVGGGSNVPLGFISLSENLGMMGMAFWMIAKYVVA